MVLVVLSVVGNFGRCWAEKLIESYRFGGIYFVGVDKYIGNCV